MRTIVNTTVIIPTKGNRLNLLQKAVKSVFANIYLPKQIIIVVDNNVEAFFKIKSIYKEKNSILVVHNTLKNGVSATRNFGAKFAQTKYISFLDDDDYWEKNLLQEIFTDKNFDVALAGFKKKKNNSLINEKLPPLELNESLFYVKNPGIRGSNITIKKELFNKIGGFNEDLLSFNDMDFGIRISRETNIRYKPIRKYLVVFNSHNEKRISTAGGKENIQGLTEFLIIHGDKITYLEEAKYRKRAIKLWNIDPYSLEYLEKRFNRIRTNKEKFNSQFTNLLHASETLLLEKIYELDDSVDKIQSFIDKLCYQYELYNPNRLFSMKIALTTTNSRYAVENLIKSAVFELEKSKFNFKSTNTIIEFLVIENSTKSEIIKNNKEFCNNFKHNKIKINYIGWEEKNHSNDVKKSFQIAQSRTFLINTINSLNWEASNIQPIWILDDDFEFTSTVPAKAYQIKNIRLGSIFHRLECIAQNHKLDAIVGGNSGSPPIPELSTIKLQLNDLKEILQQKYAQKNWKETLKNIQQNPDYYYDLSRVDIQYFPVVKEIPKNVSKCEFIDVFLNKLLTGVPATRFMLANFNSNNEYNSAWNLYDKTAVSGGNTIYFNSALFNSENYWVVKYNNIKSRRGDAIWFLLSLQKGFKIEKMNFPLTHARKKRINDQHDITNLINKALKDILGVALWETIKEKKYSELKNIDKKILYQRIKKRLNKFENNMEIVEQLLYEIGNLVPEAKQLKSFKTLLYISRYKIRINNKKIKLINYGN